MSIAVTDREYPSSGHPEPDLTPEDLLARVAALVPGLVERQAETERRTYYAPEVHDAFTRAGLYRILVPRRYGGYEFGAETFMRVAMTLARGCPSTGWMYLFGAAHALPMATLFDRPAQDELFRGGDFICPVTVVPGGTAERAGAGHWRISGTWSYCSGAPYATHFAGHTLVPGENGEPEPMLFVVPRRQWTRLDDWGGQLGLRGSGSHSITVDDALVPDRFTVRTHLSQVTVPGDTPGRRLYDNPEYGGGQLSFMLLELGVLAAGMARGALDAYEQLMTARTTIYPPIHSRADDADYQFRYAEASAMIDTAEAAALDAVRQWSALCAREPAAFGRAEELRLALISREAVRLCWRAVESHLFPTAGSSSVRHGQRIERVWRDMSMMHSHAGLGVFLAHHANREFSRARFGRG
ncbi:acyl-CoA dehydrogenase family protein [Actinoplanes siamensis]|uniref:Pigment protein n=1 Tax=Actinoplanes siamensis TaxID=1223317 RepID=A0A919N9Z8_9ACTN|nr:acyl-CoA dehydrogenase family protein [Actinoplanes siamensis]GIF07036.1 pigment protein [Actinoplanes siamensis]